MKTTKQPEKKLVEAGLITDAQLEQARAQAAQAGTTVVCALLDLKLIDPAALADWLSDELHLPRVELKSYLIGSEVLEMVPEALARKHQVIPLFNVKDAVTVATADPTNLTALDEVQLKIGKRVELAVATRAEIVQALGQYYGATGQLSELVADLKQETMGLEPGKVPDAKQLEELVQEPPVVRLVNLLLTDAVRQRASDIHMEAESDQLRVRFRVDGILRDFTTFAKHLEPAVVSRIKILADLDIAERRKPQDGRFRISIEGHDLDLRVSVMPAIDGETVVLRLLDTQGLNLNLEKLGMEPTLLAGYQELLKRTWGIILVTGPTGSGKTTSLYASLASLNSKDRNIVTIEDPVEYRLEGITQIPVSAAVDLSFSTGLRSILRQDPDIIMVGEIRDRETAEVAIQAALTGHQVFSTLHTNDAPTAVTRLLDMGIEPFLISSSLSGVVAQRLVRTICPECKKPDPAQLEIAKSLGFTQKGNWARGKGCRNCGETGYQGRIAIFEMMIPTEALYRGSGRGISAADVRSQAVANGMRPLREDGLMKAAAGLTTVEEVLRVTQES